MKAGFALLKKNRKEIGITEKIRDGIIQEKLVFFLWMLTSSCNKSVCQKRHKSQSGHLKIKL